VSSTDIVRGVPTMERGYDDPIDAGGTLSSAAPRPSQEMATGKGKEDRRETIGGVKGVGIGITKQSREKRTKERKVAYDIKTLSLRRRAGGAKNLSTTGRKKEDLNI